MWKIWLLFDVRRVMVGLHVGLAVLAFTIHFILLSTDRYNWLDYAPPGNTGPVAETAAAAPADYPA